MQITLVTRSPSRRLLPFGPDVPSRMGRRVSVDFQSLKVDRLSEDLASLAALVFEIEGLSRTHPSIELDGASVRVRGCSVQGGRRIERALQSVLEFCVERSMDVSVSDGESPPSETIGGLTPRSDAILLFSGGTDSLSGLALCERKGIRTTSVFVAHGSGTTGLINRLLKHTLAERLTDFCPVRVQRRGELQQTRGFLYTVLGGIVGRIRSTGDLVISESGPTMFIPPITPLDEVTLTTNPVVLSLARNLVMDSLGWKLRIHTPFRDLTKAESIAWIRRDPTLPETNSCARPQFASHRNPHCGSCFGCLVRRVSFLVANVTDRPHRADPLFSIPADDGDSAPKSPEDVSEERMADVLAVLSFCRDVLLDRVSPMVKEQLRTYDVERLFQRFALDFLAALNIGYRKGGFGRNPAVQKIYDACVKDELISNSIARERIEEVAALKHKPRLDMSPCHAS